uniref:Glutamine amidotransferase type-2 domain-containing protein n=2 Tax=Staphylothermus marinus TaxID=2280 RepID=A0A7C4D7T6_STAMA
MCRILISSFNTDKIDVFKDILNSFIKSSERDILLEKLSNRSSHSDGWGLASIGLANNTPSILFHKTLLPIYHSQSRDIVELFIKRMELYDNIKVIVHSRLSSRREPYGERYSHPFEVLENNLTIWFIHNGGVDKKELSKEIGINPYYYSDSWISAIYISKYLNKCVEKETDLDNCVIDSYRNLIKYTIENSALDTGLLLLYKDTPYLYTSFYVKGYMEMNDDRKEYYNMYKYVEEGFIAVSSSTVKYYSSRDFSLIEQGLYSIRNNNLVKLDSYQ